MDSKIKNVVFDLGGVLINLDFDNCLNAFRKAGYVDCGIFHPNSVAVARYGALIRAKYPTNCDAHLAESLFQTRSRTAIVN